MVIINKYCMTGLSEKATLREKILRNGHRTTKKYGETLLGCFSEKILFVAAQDRLLSLIMKLCFLFLFLRRRGWIWHQRRSADLL